MPNQITIKAHVRPCLVGGKPALWHLWTRRQEIVAPSPLNGGHNGGVIAGAFALVEFLDGHVEEVLPQRVHFLDTEEMLREGLEMYFDNIEEVEE